MTLQDAVANPHSVAMTEPRYIGHVTFAPMHGKDDHHVWCEPRSLGAVARWLRNIETAVGKGRITSTWMEECD